ncbi:MAG TPA: hypothetical protein VFP91_19220 [Vicinamibacterales bacterium]|nr:hypothetical protein [Vicinamibacterales bacterium]
MRRAAAILFLVFTAGLTMSAAGRHQDVARFSARSVEMPSAARLSFRHVDIAISQWSTDQDHRFLARTLLERGPVGFVDVLCGYPAVGTIAVAGGSAMTIRYAWQTPDRDGGQRIYLATDEPIVLVGSEFRRFAEAERLYFIELRLDRRGDGVGKLSDGVRLSVDQSRNVIELRDFERRPLQLVMVHDEMVD